MSFPSVTPTSVECGDFQSLRVAPHTYLLSDSHLYSQATCTPPLTNTTSYIFDFSPQHRLCVMWVCVGWVPHHYHTRPRERGREVRGPTHTLDPERNFEAYLQFSAPHLNQARQHERFKVWFGRNLTSLITVCPSNLKESKTYQEIHIDDLFHLPCILSNVGGV
jgi:hypothetical protein